MSNKLTNYIRDSRLELKKVSWPTKKTTTNYTLLVLGVSISMAIFLALIDYLSSLGIEKLIIR